MHTTCADGSWQYENGVAGATPGSHCPGRQPCRQWELARRPDLKLAGLRCQLPSCRTLPPGTPGSAQSSKCPYQSVPVLVANRLLPAGQPGRRCSPADIKGNTCCQQLHTRESLGLARPALGVLLDRHERICTSSSVVRNERLWTCSDKYHPTSFIQGSCTTTRGCSPPGMFI